MYFSLTKNKSDLEYCTAMEVSSNSKKTEFPESEKSNELQKLDLKKIYDKSESSEAPEDFQKNGSENDTERSSNLPCSDNLEKNVIP